MKKLSQTLLMILCLVKYSLFFSQQYDGLTYYSLQNATTGYLIDTNSTVVKTYNFTGGTGYSTHFMPGGFMYRTVQNQGNVITGGGTTGRIQKLDYSANILWDYTYSSSTYCLHHDHCPLPNGNVLVISYDVKTASDATAAGASTAMVIWSEKIMELQPVGTNSATVVWEWKLWDHLVQNVNPSAANYQSSIVNNPQLMNINYKLTKDWIHMNGIDYNPVLDQITFSSHFMNEWFVIDHSTTTAQAATHSGGNAGMGGDFLYRWGNPASYGATGTTNFNVTHDAHWIPENCTNGGNLAGINNRGITTPSSKTTADQVILPRNGYNYNITLGSAYGPATYSARKVTTGYTTNMGSVQEFPNGNMLICLATLGTVYEIDAAGNTLWTKSTGGALAQSHRYPLCYLTNPAPVQPSITVNGNNLSTATAASYQWYLNGMAISNATLQTYQPTQSGIYLVRTNDGISCADAYSQGQQFTASGPVTGLNTEDTYTNLTFYPNPTTGILNISGIEGNYNVTVRDLTGKVVMEVNSYAQADLSGLNGGLYLVNIRAENGATINKRVTLVK